MNIKGLRDTHPILPSPEACLFVANLPSNLANEELSYKLLEVFKNYGKIIFIKTSRDSKGRPFGFVQYENPEFAAIALRYSQIIICGRKVRIEKAQCLRKIQIKFPESIENFDTIKNILKDYADSDDIIFLEDENPVSDVENKKDANTEHIVKRETIVIMKLIDTLNADNALQKLQAIFPKYKVEWLNFNTNVSDELNQKAIHSYKEKISKYEQHGSFAKTSRKHPLGDDSSSLAPPNGVSHNDSKLDDPSENTSVNHDDHRIHIQPSSEIKLDEELDLLSIKNENKHPFKGFYNGKKYISHEEETNEIFVGRLTSSLITEDMIHSKFSQYGELLNVHMVNKKSFGIPQDAFAFIKFKDQEDAQKAIDFENGKKWLGQNIKVSWAISKPHSSSLRTRNFLHVDYNASNYLFSANMQYPYSVNFDPFWYSSIYSYPKGCQNQSLYWNDNGLVPRDGSLYTNYYDLYVNSTLHANPYNPPPTHSCSIHSNETKPQEKPKKSISNNVPPGMAEITEYPSPTPAPSPFSPTGCYKNEC